MTGDLFTGPARPPRRVRRPKPLKQIVVTITADGIAAVMTRHTTAEAMITEAVYAAVPEASKVAIDLGSIRWTDPAGQRMTFATPTTVRYAMIELSRGCAHAPFRFVLGHAKRVARC